MNLRNFFSGFLTFLFLAAFDAPATGHEESSSSPREFGPDQAITAAENDRGFRLSPLAIKTIDLKTVTYQNALPEAALVRHQDRVGVYRLRDGWVKLIPKSEIRPGDEIAVQSVGLLRAAELDAFPQNQESSHD